MEKLVSVIIPTYNRASLISETLESIEKQTFQNWECLIIDDGSEDETSEVVNYYVSKDSRFRYFRRPDNIKKGGPSCRNLGYELSNGKYIQWFDSDDIMLPELLSEKVKIIEEESVDFVVSKMGEFENLNDITYPDYSTNSANMVIDYLQYRIFFLTPGPIFKKTFLQKFDLLFDVNLIKHQEWEFYSRIVLNGGKGFYTDKFHCLRRMHAESIKSLTNTVNPQIKNLNKFNAILALNKNTNYQYQGMIRSIFLKRIAKAVLRAFAHGEIKYGLVFFRMLVKLFHVKAYSNS